MIREGCGLIHCRSRLCCYSTDIDRRHRDDLPSALLPLLSSDGAGAEVMKRVAAPMVGGLLTSAFLTLEVLPVLYTIWRYRQLRRAELSHVPIAGVIGQAPAWARR